MKNKSHKKKIVASNVEPKKVCCDRHLPPPQVVIKNRRLVTIDSGEPVVFTDEFEGVQCHVLPAESVKTLMRDHRLAGVFFDAHDPRRERMRQEVIMHLYAAETKIKLDSVSALGAAGHLGRLCYSLDHGFQHRVEVVVQSILFLLSR